MSKSKRLASISVLAAAASVIPPLPAALSALSPIASAQAAQSGQPSLKTLAQIVARGENTIAPSDLRSLILSGRPTFTLIDLRTPEAFATGHIRNAVNIPLPRLFEEKEIVHLRRLPHIIIYGRATSEAAQAAVLLRLAGVPAVALEGGLNAWARGLKDEATSEQSAAIVRALNMCPSAAPASIPPPQSTAAPAPSVQGRAKKPEAPKAKRKKPAINLKGICG